MNIFQIWCKIRYYDNSLAHEYTDEDEADLRLEQILNSYREDRYFVEHDQDESGVWKITDRQGDLYRRYWIEIVDALPLYDSPAFPGGLVEGILGAINIQDDTDSIEVERQAANTYCECCDFRIGEADDQNPALCANCGAYARDLIQQAAQRENKYEDTIDKLGAQISELTAINQQFAERAAESFAERRRLREALENIVFLGKAIVSDVDLEDMTTTATLMRNTASNALE